MTQQIDPRYDYSSLPKWLRPIKCLEPLVPIIDQAGDELIAGVKNVFNDLILITYETHRGTQAAKKKQDK
jgi:hypothetical protein